MIETLKKRVAREESGFTLIELLVVIIILGILLAIAVPSYLGLKDRADKSAAQSNVRAIIPDVEQYNADNVGTGEDPSLADGSTSTSGYAGISETILKSKYDQAIDTNKVHVTSFTSGSDTLYCAYATSGKFTAYKAGPSAEIQVRDTSSSAFNTTTCS